MATYKVTSPNGKSLKITGNQPPSEQELNNIFSASGDKPKESFGMKAFKFGKDIVNQATGMPRMINEIGRGARNAPVLNIQEKQLSQLRQQPLTQERVAKEEEIADRMKYITKDTPFGLSAEDKQRAGQGVGESIELGLQRSAGTGAFFVPGGAGAKLGTKALLGGASGALTGASMGEDIDPIQTGIGFATGAAVPVAMHGVQKGVQAVGKGMQSMAKKYALKGLRPTKTQMFNFKKKMGVDLADYMAENGLIDPSRLDDVLAPVQDAFDAKALKPNATASVDDIIAAFDEAIAKNTQGGSQLDPTSRSIGEFLEKEKQNFIMGFGETGTMPLGELTAGRRGVDRATPSRHFNPGEHSKQRTLGNIYRGVATESGGTGQLGQELKGLYAFKEIADKQSNLGRGSQAFNILKPTAGGGIAGLALNAVIPGGQAASVLVGAGLGYLVNNPKFISFVSQQALQTGGRLAEKELIMLANQFVQKGAITAGTRALDNPFGESEQDMLGEKPQGSNVNMKKNPYKSNKVNVEYKF